MISANAAERDPAVLLRTAIVSRTVVEVRVASDRTRELLRRGRGGQVNPLNC